MFPVVLLPLGHSTRVTRLPRRSRHWSLLWQLPLLALAVVGLTAAGSLWAAWP